MENNLKVNEHTDEKKIKRLVDYYKDNGLLIVGFNDSQGVNTTPLFFKKGLLEYLAAALTMDEFAPTVINAFSLLMNKTEHIDYFLKYNLSLEEIKWSQIYSFVSALEKVMKDVGLPQAFGKIGNVSRLIYRTRNGDDKIRLTSSLKGASEPVLIYSSGVNDLMREVGNNPFSIGKDYQARKRTPNYNYTLEKVENPETLRKVMDGIERNFEQILKINLSTDIYTLGAYIPKALQSKEMNIFRDLVIAYNEELQKLCKQYGAMFIDTENVGRQYNTSEVNFHISSAGHNALANYILGCMYHNKFEMYNNWKIPNQASSFRISNRGLEGVISSISMDCAETYNRATELSGYAMERELKIADEHRREIEVFKKVLARKK